MPVAWLFPRVMSRVPCLKLIEEALCFVAGLLACVEQSEHGINDGKEGVEREHGRVCASSG